MSYIINIISKLRKREEIFLNKIKIFYRNDFDRKRSFLFFYKRFLKWNSYLNANKYLAKEQGTKKLI
jgi:hypothetical protein